MSKIALLITSTRPSRVAVKVADWLLPIAKDASPDMTITTVDVADFKLPLFDETVIPAMVPAMAKWTKPYAEKWSDEISKYDGYILLANEYNFCVSSSTKNAIDYLYHAWIGKPIIIVTYGIKGGNSASDALKTILTGMKLRPVETRPQLAFAGEPQGPDVMAALGGELAEDSKKKWAAEEKASIEKGVRELTSFLREAQPVGD